MFYRYGCKGKAAYTQSLSDRLGKNMRFAAPRLGLPENIRKPFFQFFNSRLIPIYRYRVFPGQGAYIVKSVKMVGVGMSQEYRIQASNIRSDGLESEFRARVYHEPLSRVPHDVKRGPHTLVP
jgi:hypothetical protein